MIAESGYLDGLRAARRSVSGGEATDDEIIEEAYRCYPTRDEDADAVAFEKGATWMRDRGAARRSDCLFCSAGGGADHDCETVRRIVSASERRFRARRSVSATPDAPEPDDPNARHFRLLHPPGLHDNTYRLVVQFANALARKLRRAEEKYGYSDGWRDSSWMDECRTKLVEHIAKGDPLDVAAYCAFLFHHGESTAVPAPGGGVPADCPTCLHPHRRGSNCSTIIRPGVDPEYCRCSVPPHTEETPHG